MVYYTSSNVSYVFFIIVFEWSYISYPWTMFQDQRLYYKNTVLPPLSLRDKIIWPHYYNPEKKNLMINAIFYWWQCTRKLGLYDDFYSKIKKCFMNREFSDLLMIRHGNRTQNLPQSAQMPSITFNGVSIEQNYSRFIT